MIVVRFPARDFSSHCCRVQTGSGDHPASYPMRSKDAFPGVNRPGSEADHSLPSSAPYVIWNHWVNVMNTSADVRQT